MDPPPQYDTLTSTPATGPLEELVTEHEYPAQCNASNWATLNLVSRARSDMDPPCFIEGDIIAGFLNANIEGKHVKAITISVEGRLTVDTLQPGDYNEVFLEMEEVLWTKDSWNATGWNMWPFSVQLPTEVKLRSKLTGTTRSYILPRTFFPAYGVTVQYNINLTLSRGRFRPDINLGTPLSYEPLLAPESMTISRQFACIDGSPLPGPDGDPTGWTALKPMRILGTVFDSRLVDAKFTVYLAKPLCYTRGSFIPCTLKLESDDHQTLNLLASPVAFPVRLFRIIVASPKPPLPPKDVIEHLESAIWWPSTTPSSDPRLRILSGEIRLSKALEPSTAISTFAIIYSVVVFPFEAFAFKSAEKVPWVSKTIEITTSYAEGPHPMPNIPPGYEVIHKPSVVDYEVPITVFA